MSHNDGPSERSPLLPKPHDQEQETLTDAENLLDSGIEADGPDGWSEEAARARRYSGPEGWASDVGARRRFSSSAGRQKLYEGMPEVRARMKYILPALAIGVYIYVLVLVGRR